MSRLVSTNALHSRFPGVRRILAIKLKNLGDVLLMVPALRALRETYPDAHLTVLVAAGTEEMLTGIPWINEIITVARPKVKHGFWLHLGRDMRFVRQIRDQRFDLVVDFTSGDRAALFGYLCGAPIRMGRDPRGRGFPGKRRLYTHLAPPPDPARHTVENDLDLLRVFGIDTKDDRLEFAVPEETEKSILNLLRTRGIREGEAILLVHPTSRWLFKCWSDEAMAETLDRVDRELGVKVVMTCGPDTREVAKAQSIRGKMRTAPVTFFGETTLKALGAFSRRAALYLGVDSAPAHIAAAVGTPAVVLFGPSAEHNWRPWRVPHRVVALPMDCRPCRRDGCNGTKVSRCLTELPHAMVFDAVKEQLCQGRAGDELYQGDSLGKAWRTDTAKEALTRDRNNRYSG